MSSQGTVLNTLPTPLHPSGCPLVSYSWWVATRDVGRQGGPEQYLSLEGQIQGPIMQHTVPAFILSGESLGKVNGSELICWALVGLTSQQPHFRSV